MTRTSVQSSPRSWLFDFLVQSSALPKKLIWQQWYNLISRSPTQGSKWTLMNYGYKELAAKKEKEFWQKWEGLNLAGLHANQFYMARLYYHLATRWPDLDFAGKEMVEVGSGRGGGAAFLAQNLPVKTYTGVDLSPKAIKFCQKTHVHIKNLRFIAGDSQKLPFANESADIVINVESSHCYPNFAKFVSEVQRVLRPGGIFLYTDFRSRDVAAQLDAAFRSANFTVLVKDDITRNVFKSLEHESKEKEDFLERTFPKFAQGILKAFAGTKGTFMFEGLRSRELAYPLYVLEK